MKTKTLFTILWCLLPGGLICSCSDTEKADKGDIKKPVIRFDAPEDVYTVKIGKTLVLSPAVENNENAAYRWLMDDEVVGRESTYRFTSMETGSHFIVFEVSNALYTVDKEIRVDVLTKVPPRPLRSRYPRGVSSCWWGRKRRSSRQSQTLSKRISLGLSMM